jgi:hypothetical protein
MGKELALKKIYRGHSDISEWLDFIYRTSFQFGRRNAEADPRLGRWPRYKLEATYVIG